MEIKDIRVKDDFLDDIHLTQLDEIIDTSYFPWYLSEEQVTDANDGCWFSHVIYDFDEPASDSFTPVINIFRNHLKYVSLCRITINLLLRQENPNIGEFHTDFQHNHRPMDEKKITTALFYLNTNNGATEFKDGDRIDCVRNRLIMFPTTTFHRAIGQTDVNKRIVLNFNFIHPTEQ